MAPLRGLSPRSLPAGILRLPKGETPCPHSLEQEAPLTPGQSRTRRDTPLLFPRALSPGLCPSVVVWWDAPAKPSWAPGSTRGTCWPRRAHALAPIVVSQRPRRWLVDLRPHRLAGARACGGQGRVQERGARAAHAHAQRQAAARAELGDGGGGAESVSSRPGAAGPGSARPQPRLPARPPWATRPA